MTRFSRLPVAYAALTLAFGLLSYPIFQNTFQSSGSSAPLQIELQSPAQQKQEKAKLVAFIAQHYAKPPSMVSNIVDEATVQARSKGIDPLLFLALIGVESSFDPHAESKMGAVGLSQVLPSAHPEKISAARKAGKSASDIRENIKMGVNILAEYRRLHNGDMRLALLRYNGSLKDPRGRYAAKVMAAHATLENVVGRKPLYGVAIVAAP